MNTNPHAPQIGLLTATVAAAALGLALGSASLPVAADEPSLSPEDFERAKTMYFQRCAGCHGVLRKGATGGNLEPTTTRDLGQQRLERIIALGTEGGMNNHDDVFTPEEISCDGCILLEGRLFTYCTSCEVRPCALEHKVNNCGYCDDYICERLEKLWGLFESQQARMTLDEVRRGLEHYRRAAPSL